MDKNARGFLCHERGDHIRQECCTSLHRGAEGLSEIGLGRLDADEDDPRFYALEDHVEKEFR